MPQRPPWTRFIVVKNDEDAREFTAYVKEIIGL